MKKKKTKKINKVVGDKVPELYVSIETISSGGEIEDPDDRWSSRTDRYTEITVTGLFLSRPDTLYAKKIEHVECKPKVGDTVYVLAVRYQTGDTFGTEHGEAFFEGAYESLEAAEKIAEAIRADANAKIDYYLSDYNKKGGPKPKYTRSYVPWNGYFERLEDIEIHCMVVKKYNPEYDRRGSAYKFIKHY